MKNFIIKLSLIAILVIAANSAMAVFTDNAQIQVLMHCDATNQGVWLTTPDDNSSGRPASEPILNLNIYYDSTNNLTEPTLMPGSPEGGSYFSFDGVDDSINISSGMEGWKGGDSAVCNLSFRWFGLPAASDPYTVLVACDAFTCFLTTMGSGLPHISLMVKQNVMIQSPVTVESNTWYDVRVSIVNDDVSITVNGSTYTEHSAFPFPDMTSPLSIGYYLRTGQRYLYGDMDEIEIGNIPEPFTFGLIGLLGLLVLKK